MSRNKLEKNGRGEQYNKILAIWLNLGKIEKTKKSSF